MDAQVSESGGSSQGYDLTQHVLDSLRDIQANMQSMSGRLSKIEGEQSSKTPLTSTPSKSQSDSSSGYAAGYSWADKMDEVEKLRESMTEDPDIDGEQDTKGVKLFSLSESSKAFLEPVFTSAIPNTTRRQLKDKFGAPNTAFTATPSLDKVLKSRVSANVKGRDKDLARLQSLALDAVGPITAIIEGACDGSLTPANNLEAAKTALRFLGNFSMACNRERRTNVLAELNPRIVDMAEEDELFKDAEHTLFGTNFCQKAKERDDQLKALNGMSKTASTSTKPASKKPFFQRGSFQDRKDRRNNPSNRGKSRFAPYSGQKQASKDKHSL